MQISVQSGQEVSTSEQWQPEPQLIEFEAAAPSSVRLVLVVRPGAPSRVLCS